MDVDNNDKKIPKGWKKVKLGEVAIINPKESLKKGIIAKKVPMEALQPFTKKIQFFIFENYNGGVKFKNCDTLVARITPSLENGKTVYVDFLNNDEIGFGSTEFIVLREKNGITDRQFIYYFAISNDFRDIAIKSMTGSSGRQRVQTEVVKDFQFYLPPLSEQKAIASVLSSLDDKIDLLHRQNQTLEKMAETLFRKWFIEEAKEDWEEKALKDICVIYNGYAFKSSTYTDFGIKIIRTLNFSNHWIELNDLVYIPEDLAIKYESYYLKRKDFLLVMVGASIGNFAIVTKDILPALQNQNMWCFRVKKGLSQHYLNYLLQQIIIEALQGSSGSAREFFQKSAFYEIKVKLPHMHLLNKFEEIVELYFSKIEINRFQIRTLEQLRDTLLPKLMSGEVRIKY